MVDCLREYSLVECLFEGSTVDLRGQEKHDPDLISETESGYPFCQRLEQKAVNSGIEGFFTPSARHRHGVSVPIFNRDSIVEPQIICKYEAINANENVVFRTIFDIV